MNLRTASLLVFLLSGHLLLAQAPSGINYQAIARLSDGSALADTEIKIRISILSGSGEGTLDYRETHQLRTNAFGLFNLIIGQGSSADKFENISWSDPESKWIKIEIDPNAGSRYELLGIQQLLSVPYALFAASAGAADPLVSRLTQEEIDALSTEQAGRLVFNTSTQSLNILGDDGWYAVKTEKVESSFSCGGILTDERDGQTYPTVSIGEQCWMARNLNYGTQINGAVNQSNNGTVEKYCYQNTAASCETYGGLYQWDEMMNYSHVKGSQGICPDGWHVPTDTEVQAMEIALGMTANEAARENVWRGSDQGLNLQSGGSTGFNVLLSGRRVSGGLFTAMNDYEYIWTSTESVDAAWRRCLRANDGQVGRYNTFPKEYGMSVRCIKD